MKKRIIPILIFFGLLFGMALFPYIPMTIFRFDVSTFSKKMQILYSLCCDLGYMIIVFMIYQKRMLTELTDYFHNFNKHYKMVIAYYLIGFVLMIISNNIISFFFEDAVANNNETVKSLLGAYPYYMIFSIVIYAPIIEETIFRRAIKDIVIIGKEKNITKYLYILISGLIFASMHVIGQTTGYADYLYLIPYMALGSIFAIIYYKTDNLWWVITLHAFHNTFALLIYFLLGV